MNRTTTRLSAVIAIAFALALPLSSHAQWRDLYWDANDQSPKILDGLYSGNTPYLRGHGPTNDDYTGWTMAFKYRYSQYSTNGEVSIASSAITNNVVEWLGPTNNFFAPYNKYFFEVVGTSTQGYIKTYCQGTFVQAYSPGAGVSPALYSTLNWALFGKYLYTSTYGPYRFNAVAYAGITTNADGSINIPAPTVGGATWGTLTGTLSAQTDLYTVLTNKLNTSSNLSDLASAATARSNLGLGSSATNPASAFATAAQGTLADGALPRSGGTATNLQVMNQLTFLDSPNIYFKTEKYGPGGGLHAWGIWTGTNAMPDLYMTDWGSLLAPRSTNTGDSIVMNQAGNDSRYLQIGGTYNLALASNLMESVWTPSNLVAVAGTVTVTRANGSLVQRTPTNNSTIVLSPADFPTGTVATVTLCIYAGSYSWTWTNAVSTVTFTNAPTLPTNAWAAPITLLKNVDSSNAWKGVQQQ